MTPPTQTLTQLAEAYALGTGYRQTYDRNRLAEGYEAGARAALQLEEVVAMREALQALTGWAIANHEMPNYSERIANAKEALAAFDALLAERG